MNWGGRLIQQARTEARRREFAELVRENPFQHDRLLAYWWWGWDIHGRSGLGRPGSSL